MLEKSKVSKKSKYIIIKCIEPHKTFIHFLMYFIEFREYLSITFNKIYENSFERSFECLNVRESIYRKISVFYF